MKSNCFITSVVYRHIIAKAGEKYKDSRAIRANILEKSLNDGHVARPEGRRARLAGLSIALPSAALALLGLAAIFAG